MSDENRHRLTPLSSDSLVQRAYDSIRHSIIGGQFAMGERIVEAKIAEQLGISRAPVREALQRLKQEGLIIDRPRRGPVVREITGKDIVDLYNVRIAVESAAIRLLLRRGAALEGIERTVALMTDAARRRDMDATVHLEFTFHQQICDASGNQYLADLFHSLSGPVRMAMSLDDAAYENFEDVATEHVPLLEAMRSGDADRAVEALQHHIVSTVGPVLARLGGDDRELLAPQWPGVAKS